MNFAMDNLETRIGVEVAALRPEPGPAAARLPPLAAAPTAVPTEATASCLVAAGALALTPDGQPAHRLEPMEQ